MIATSGFLPALEYTKYVFGRGCAPYPAGGAYSPPPDLLAGLRGPTSEGRGGEREGRKGEGEGREGRVMTGNGRGKESKNNPSISSCIRPCPVPLTSVSQLPLTSL